MNKIILSGNTTKDLEIRSTETTEIAKLKFEEIAKEAIYKANLESINALKIEIKVLSNQYDKEWSNETV